MGKLKKFGVIYGYLLFM